ncbi:YodC family protein [Paraburkholderia edwinii]|uniref:YodC family protein n=2 Tax=Paraburkholderia edwinii TaxID=2861782 RepID=A0ABX8UQ04_9BURK|nr:YodC family protein [Paraburkholderia edwinii]
MTATWVGPVAFAPGIWLICEWFDASGKPQQGMFDAATLEPVAHA